MTVLAPNTTVSAATGINHQINFQGKLVNPDGTNVTDGSYSIIYSIYNVASAGSAIWTETQTVTLSNGIFQVNLGSVTALPGSVDFNTDNIYLGVKVGADAEMSPRIQFTSVPQAFNAEKLGGLDKTGYIQNATSPQTANFNVTGNGVVGGTLSVGTASSLSGSLKVYSATGTGSISLNLSNGASVGNYTLSLPSISANDTICLQTAANCGISLGTYSATNTDARGATLSAGVLTFQDASASAPGMVSSNNQTFGGNKTFNANVVVNGSYNTNSFSATNLTFSGVSPVIGASTINTGITLQANGTGTLSLGTTGAGTVSIANANATTLNLAANDVVHAIHLGDGGSTTVQTVTLGSLNSTSATTVQGGSGNINLTVNQSGAGVIIKTVTSNSAAALQVQNNAGNSILGVDTVASQVLLGKASTVGGQLVVYGGTSGSVTISVPAAVNGGVNYNLVLPSTPGSATQCLQNSSTPGTLQWGSCGAAGGQIRTITLVPEYPGGVLHASGINNSGTMTSEYDSTNVHSYYQWSSSLGALNNYDIIERTLIPSEYISTFGNLKIWVYNDSTVTTNNDIQVSVRAPDGTACTTNSSVLNTATIDTWVQQTVSLSGCTASNFVANGVLGLDIKLLAQNNNNVRVGEISYQYSN